MSAPVDFETPLRVAARVKRYIGLGTSWSGPKCNIESGNQRLPARLVFRARFRFSGPVRDLEAADLEVGWVHFCGSEKAVNAHRARQDTQERKTSKHWT